LQAEKSSYGWLLRTAPRFLPFRQGLRGKLPHPSLVCLRKIGVAVEAAPFRAFTDIVLPCPKQVPGIFAAEKVQIIHNRFSGCALEFMAEIKFAESDLLADFVNGQWFRVMLAQENQAFPHHFKLPPGLLEISASARYGTLTAQQAYERKNFRLYHGFVVRFSGFHFPDNGLIMSERALIAGLVPERNFPDGIVEFLTVIFIDGQAIIFAGLDGVDYRSGPPNVCVAYLWNFVTQKDCTEISRCVGVSVYSPDTISQDSALSANLDYCDFCKWFATDFRFAQYGGAGGCHRGRDYLNGQ